MSFGKKPMETTRHRKQPTHSPQAAQTLQFPLFAKRSYPKSHRWPFGGLAGD
jgi:hypothetical protein